MLFVCMQGENGQIYHTINHNIPKKNQKKAEDKISQTTARARQINTIPDFMLHKTKN